MAVWPKDERSWRPETYVLANSGEELRKQTDELNGSRPQSYPRTCSILTFRVHLPRKWQTSGDGWVLLRSCRTLTRPGQRWRPSVFRWSLANTAGPWQTETGEPSLALAALEDRWQTSEQGKWQRQLCTVALRAEELHLNSCNRSWNLPCLYSSPVASHWLYWCTLHACANSSFLLPL